MVDKIVVNSVVKQFNSVTALENVSLELDSGKIYAVLGHNGAGKTTLLQHILGIQSLKKGTDEGKISYLFNKKFVRDFKRELSYSPEIYSLYEDLSIMEYLCFVAKVYKCPKSVINKIEELIKFFDLEGKEERFIYGLSNGMKKKVSHIAALMIEGSFCFLDEPFAGLDPVSIFNLKEYLCENVKSNCSFVISTHQLAVLDSFEVEDEFLEIILMKKGKLVYKGTKRKLLEMTGESSIEKAYIKIC